MREHNGEFLNYGVTATHNEDAAIPRPREDTQAASEVGVQPQPQPELGVAPNSNARATSDKQEVNRQLQAESNENGPAGRKNSTKDWEGAR
ncbi:hypothetical protein GP486_002123 [Trichoglossum hirsutum]|uniref:Uncharacterized protein n=1 Tax=Trichoglossum hirsutum TaxID=265104 RepID=A0A9P8LFP8_9PEZI|nr:hypothetical protein GP486_002123 [Trichoglossum hirsutum]